ncbi:hypothetical protein Tco_0680790 [Tanacetum coccineum]|uniref:Uncharacterized protein n=1 Tax=Tanacetum coccineum TaxID=301880 RepID=A0ABQ4XMY0_9ASTR
MIEDSGKKKMNLVVKDCFEFFFLPIYDVPITSKISSASNADNKSGARLREEEQVFSGIGNLASDLQSKKG